MQNVPSVNIVNSIKSEKTNKYKSCLSYSNKILFVNTMNSN